MKYVKLTKGMFAKVDDDDYDRVVALGSWYCHSISKELAYACNSSRDQGRQKKVYMHRLQRILEKEKCNMRIPLHTKR